MSEALGEQTGAIQTMILAKPWSCQQQANAGLSWGLMMVLIRPNSVGQMHPKI